MDTPVDTCSLPQEPRQEVPRRHDLDSLVPGSAKQSAISGNDARRVARDPAGQELDVVLVVTSVRRHWERLHNATLTDDQIQSRPSAQAARIDAGGPAKKIPDIRTFVSRTILIRAGGRFGRLS